MLALDLSAQYTKGHSWDCEIHVRKESIEKEDADRNEGRRQTVSVQDKFGD
jgi:hypothetical protein